MNVPYVDCEIWISKKSNHEYVYFYMNINNVNIMICFNNC